VPSETQSIALHDADAIWAVELPIEFEIVLLYTPSTIFMPYIVRRTFLRRIIGYLSLLSGPTFHCCTAGTGGSRSCRSLIFLTCQVRCEYLFAVWILRCISKPTSFFGVTRALKYTISLTTSKLLQKSHILSGVEDCYVSSCNFVLKFINNNQFFSSQSNKTDFIRTGT
jgi:hypothetical protein